MSIEPVTPVIVGVAQRTWRPDKLPGPEPLLAWEQAVRAAAEDACISSGALKKADLVGVVDLLSWTYDDAPARLADKIGATPRRTIYSTTSGTSGHDLVFNAAEAIRAGQSDLVVLAGGEALATRRLVHRTGGEIDWSYPAPPDRPPVFQYSNFQHPGEVALGLYEDIGAVNLFAMRDIARRAHLKITPDDYMRQTGELMAGMTEVAAANPDAWFPIARDPSFLMGRRPDNRMIAYPYTKHVCAIIDVDISAACIMTSEGHANRLGVPRQKRVYPWAGSYAQDPTFTAARRELWRSTAMHAAANALKKATGITADQIDYADLYSCFPSAVRFACDALGLMDCNGRSVTVTGGLPYAGGPGSAYLMTSVAKMTECLRAEPNRLGVIGGVGMLMQNHAFGLYSATPPPPTVRQVDNAAVQAEVDAVPLVHIDDGYRGPVTVVAYTVKYDRADQPTHGAVLCDLPNGARAHAIIRDPELIEQAETTELVGRRLLLTGSGPVGELRTLL